MNTQTIWQDNPAFKELVWCERVLIPGARLAFVVDAHGNKAVLKVEGRAWQIRNMRTNRPICRGYVGALSYREARREAYRSWRVAVGRGLFNLSERDEVNALIEQLNNEDRERERT